MHIKPLDRTIKDILGTNFYRIPRFQRPYSWEKEHIEEFWTDTIATDAQDYFIGSMVFFSATRDKQTLNVVDGQQRLTTITLILCALRDKLNQLGFRDLAVGIQQLINRTDIDNVSRYVLNPETSYPYLQEYVQKFDKPELEYTPGIEEKGLEDAYKLINGKIHDTVLSVQRDRTRGSSRCPRLVNM
jgi:uncharacterized protein with ParB-like and HNH nuclease domain